MRIASIAVLVMSIFVGSAHAGPPVVQITTCGQAVPPNAHGLLMGNLDCTGFVGGIANEAISLGHHAKLDLQGFTVTGGDFGVACYEVCTDGSTGGVACDGSPCEIANGTVTGAQASGITGDRVTVRNVTVSNSGDSGVQGYRQARAYDSTLTDNHDEGIRAWTVKVYGSTITGNGRFGVGGSKYDHGRYSHGILIRDSTVTGNGMGPDCGTQFNPYCADLSSGTRPKVQRSTCNTTHAVQPVDGCGLHWCVCTIN